MAVDLLVDDRLMQTKLASSGAQGAFACGLASRLGMHFDVRVTRAALLLLTILAGGRAPAPASPSQGVPGSAARVNAFEPLEKWKRAVLAADAATLLAMYSVDPAATLGTTAGKANDVKKEVEFWTSLKSSGLRSMNLQIIQSEALQPEVERVIFELEMVLQSESGSRKMYASAGQIWMKQGDQWRIVMSQRTDLARLKQPAAPDADLYPPENDANAQIKTALTRAARDHKRVLIVFGANWCYDCHVLDAAFHSAEIEPLLEANFFVVHVDIGKGDRNQDIMRRYGVPMEKGIPALVVLESDGKLLYSQRNGEFEAARSLGPEDLLASLNKWKPDTRGR